ncbi:uncharacterized protein LOC105186623 [Harpegnathos saltator]|uniref:uncharacterized protein LOC105186623 n=1 Tax=Harpegnathos saltator TaxID=610380 RepID=UPI00058DF9C0|nr:uncharacterized protein LOC105186623 [Harpegnathos saltator]XP_011145261.1 uncharacterized protein LOC105186623 [Harpegnathos saltator]XP_011145262.1 uncharacterized protein LOC105186623 [Harpegnathos saltator]
METVTHLWNVNQFMVKLKCPLTTELQTFYMQKCKNFKDEVELPKQKFGPSVMCIHCGSLWNTMNYQARIIPGRKMSKSVKKIVKNMNEGDKDIPKVRASLAQKSIKNEMNKLVIKCAVCSKQTKLPFKKKDRLKPIKAKLEDSHTVPQNRRKKKKKKYRDKTAGLNISGCISESPLNKKIDGKTLTKSIVNTSKMKNQKTLNSSTKKAKKLNIARLRNIVNDSTTTPKSKSLHSFLAELY